MDISERPNRIPWPPILFVGALLAANGLSWLMPFGMARPHAIFVVLGTVMVACSIGLMLWAFQAFRAHKTSVLPHKRSDALISAGPFRLTRNPIYLAEAVLLGGLALVNGSIWYLAVIPPFIWAVTALAIVREEAHLAARFGGAWTAYSRQVRRWMS
ncbi:MAG: methyltransferase family protein [Bosea sp. (in: a-proteobacteria)]